MKFQIPIKCDTEFKRTVYAISFHRPHDNLHWHRDDGPAYISCIDKIEQYWKHDKCVDEITWEFKGHGQVSAANTN